MSTNAMNKAAMKGVRRGIYLSATGDTKRLRALRRQAETSSSVEIAWKNVGDRLTRSMETMEEENPSIRGRSSRNT